MYDPNEGKLVSDLDERFKKSGFGKADNALENIQREAQRLSDLTGKPHPVFSLNEIVDVKGGKFKILDIRSNRMILEPVKS